VRGDGYAACLDALGCGVADIAVDLIRAGELAYTAGFQTTYDVRVVNDFADAVDGVQRGGFPFHDLHGAAQRPCKTPSHWLERSPPCSVSAASSVPV